MSIPSPYLQGFLAAACPADRATGGTLLPPVSPAQEAASKADVSLDRASIEGEIARRPDPLESFPRLLECVSANRPPDAEDRRCFQWFGLFYEAPVQDAFRLRLRLPGGRLRPFQLVGLAEATQKFAGGQIVLNARGGLDVPGVPITAACQILAETRNIGLSSHRSGGNCIQAVRGGEYDRPDPGGDWLSVYPLVCALEQAATLVPSYADLPRPCEVVFHSGAATAFDPTIDTLALRGVGEGVDFSGKDSPPAAEAGFVLTVPGVDSDGFSLAPAQVVPGCLALLEGWRSHAARSGRVEVAFAEFLGGLDPGEIGALSGETRRVPLWHEAKADACKAPPGLTIPGARLLSGQLMALERCCREHGWREVRLAHGRLHAVADDGAWVETTAVMARALSE